VWVNVRNAVPLVDYTYIIRPTNILVENVPGNWLFGAKLVMRLFTSAINTYMVGLYSSVELADDPD